MVKHSVCAVTGSRAEFGLLRPLIEKLAVSKEIDFRLVVTGSHLESAFGDTQNEIADSGLAVHAKIPLPLMGDSRRDMAKATGAEAVLDLIARKKAQIERKLYQQPPLTK